MLKLCFTNQLLVFQPEVINLINERKEDLDSSDLSCIAAEMVKHGDITFTEVARIHEQLLESPKIADAITKLKSEIKSELLEKSKVKENNFTAISCDFEFWYTVLYCQIIQKVEKLYYSTNDKIKRGISDRAKEFWKMVSGQEREESDELKERSITYLLSSSAISYAISYAIKEDKTFIEAAESLSSYNILKYLENYKNISKKDIYLFNMFYKTFG